MFQRFRRKQRVELLFASFCLAHWPALTIDLRALCELPWPALELHKSKVCYQTLLRMPLELDLEPIGHLDAPTASEPAEPNNADMIPPGPADVEEVFEWPAQYLTNESLRDRFRLAWEAGVHLTTDYSGLGGAEVAASLIAAGVRQQCWPKNGDRCGFTFARSGDVLPECRVALLHLHKSSEGCVLGDMQERIPNFLKSDMEKIVTTGKKAVATRARYGDSRKDVAKVIGTHTANKVPRAAAVVCNARVATWTVGATLAT